MKKHVGPCVFRLGYVAIDASDIERSLDHYAGKLGLTAVGRGHDGEMYLTAGASHHEVVLHPGKAKGLRTLGYQLNRGIDLGDFCKRAIDAGLAAQLKSDVQPGIPALVEVEGPGRQVFHFYNSVEPSEVTASGQGVSPLRLGHIAIISSDAKNLIAFYRDFLGFWETDWIGDVANFLTCNYEHHVINIVNAPEDRIHHIAFQLQDSSHQTRACDGLARTGVQTVWGPSRHTAGHNIASYHFDPDRNLIELYNDMDVYIPELDVCEARPWHEYNPMPPRRWRLEELSNWGVDFIFDLAKA
jgi:catechol-2,3-dioxygenase